MNPCLSLQTARSFLLTREICRLWIRVLGMGLMMTAPGIMGDDDVKISPAQILEEAVSHSLTLKVSDQDVAAARARTLQAQAQFLPTLNLDARAGHYEGLKDATLGPGLIIPTVDNWVGASAILSQPLFTGGQIFHQKATAGFYYNATTHSRRSTEADIRLQALIAYWVWSKIFCSLETLQSAVARMNAHAADMHALYQAGLATDNDTLSTDVLLDQTRLRLEDAKRRDHVARAQIVFLIGRELPSNAVPDRAVVPADVAIVQEFEALSAARTNRAEYTARQMEWNAAKAWVRANRADYWPHMYLTARYDQAHPNPMIFPPQNEWDWDVYAGMSMNWNLLDWGLTRAKVSEASARVTQAELRLAQQDERIALEVRTARISLQDALHRLTVAERAETSAQRNLESATGLWSNGLLRHSELLDAHTQLTDARYDLETARADVLLAKTTLDYAMGLLKAEP